MIETLILHIGQSKTGTSALQTLLAEERQTLAEQGILYPDIYTGETALGLLEHNAFAESLSGILRYPHLQLESWIEQFTNQMQEKSCHTLLLSAESFFGTPQIWTVGPPDDFFAMHRKKIERLTALLPANNVHILLYLRRQDLWLESAIGHIIRYEGLLGRRVYENDQQITSLLAPHLDYLQLANLWQEVINPAQFSIIPYEREALGGGDTAQDFLERTCLDKILKLQENIPRKLENQSWSAEALTLKKQLNQARKTKTRERSIISILNRLDGRKDLEHTRFTISQDLKDRVLETHKADNRALAQTYSGPTGSFFALPDHHKTEERQTCAEGISAATMFAWLRAFEREYYRPGRSIMESLNYAKSAFRKNLPGPYSRIKGIVKPILRRSA